MRYIDPAIFDKIREDKPDWETKANQALRDIETIAEDKRSELINKKSEIWREIKEDLSLISHRKCWYCESKEERSDNAVDHFRPKSKYWWLAFKLDNYRFSCTYCNSLRKDKIGETSGGKHDHFPLLDESKRALISTDNYKDEQPLLLDPCCIDDPPLLWFDTEGQPVPHPESCEDKSSYLFKRVQKSIELYHLHHSNLVERRKKLYADIQQELKNADKMGAKALKGDNTALSAYRASLTKLTEYISEREQDSAAAKVYMIILSVSSMTAKTVLRKDNQ
jgi:uncharacterized protein (TIGR02646 family)